jgi:mono/diheme cytochrome c family protein
MGGRKENTMLAQRCVVIALMGVIWLAFGDNSFADTPTPEMLKIGEEQFVENCEVCHQADAIGEPGVAPSLINPELLSIASDTFLMATIRDGREDTGMPPFAHLGRKNVRAITAFLRSHAMLPNRAEEVDAQPDAHGDPRLGKQWYDNICSTCHGLDGDGYEAGGTGTAIGLPGFLNKVSDGFIRETIRYGRSNTRMLAFQGPTGLANLSDEEIDDIIVYLRGLAQD